MDIPSSTHPSGRDGPPAVTKPVALKTPARSQPQQAAVNDAHAVFDAAGARKLSVLLVEDDHATLVFVKTLLKSCGHTGARLSGRHPTAVIFVFSFSSSAPTVSLKEGQRSLPR
jgi:hypothetical protein